MAFIKNLTEKLLANEFRVISNFYNSKNIGDDTEYLGFIKTVGALSYGVVIINADRKYDYRGFFADVRQFFAPVGKVILLGIFVSSAPSDELVSFCTNDIEDYQEELITVKWIADIGKGCLTVKGSQPDKLLNLDRLVRESFGSGEYNPPTDIELLKQKQTDIKNSYLKSDNIYLTAGIIVLNGIILLLMELMGGSYSADVLVKFGAVEKNLVFIHKELYRVFTYMFLHIGIMHYACNSLSLYILGSRVERYYGKLKMLVIYLLSGILGGIFSAAFANSVSAGASGAIFGLMAAVFVYTRIKCRSMDGFDNYFVIIFALIGIGSGFLMPNVDNFGHIGGFLGGLASSIILLAGDKNE